MLQRLSLVLLFLVLPTFAQATNYFVRVDGSDAHTGTTDSAGGAWLTLQKAASTMVAGDITTVGDGTYVSGQVQFNVNAGTAANPITLKAQNKWGAILSSTSSCNPNISYYKSYITVDGLSLVIDAGNVYCTPNSASGTGIRMWPDNGSVGGVAKNIKTDDPTVAQGKVRSHGVKSNQPNSIIQDSTLGAGVETLNADYAIIRRNTITGGGAWFNGIVTKGGGKNVQVYNNVINGLTTITSSGIILGGANASDLPAQECWNCVAYNNVVITSATAVALKFQGCKNCAFYNNVVFNGSIGMSTAPSSLSSGNTWKNNIFSCNGAKADSGFLGSFTLDYNNFYNCVGNEAQTHPVVGNPLFVNPASDWHLTAGSSSIGAGQVVLMTGFAGESISVATDAGGTTRIPPVDLGIYDAGVIGPDLTPPAAPTGLTVSPR